MLSEKSAASYNIVTPVSEKKLRSVKSGSLTETWTQSKTPRTTSSPIATRSKFFWNTPQTSLANEYQMLLIERLEPKYDWGKGNSETTRYMFGDNGYFIQMALHTKANLRRADSQDVPYLRVDPCCSPLQLPPLSHKWLVIWSAVFHLSASHPAFLGQSIKQHPEHLLGAWLSPPIKIVGQKQLSIRPIVEIQAMVDNIKFTKSSRKFLQSCYISIIK